MAPRFFYRNNDGDAAELVDRVRTGDIELVTHAEEGSVGSAEIPVDDQQATFLISGHRIVSMQEDEIDHESDPHAGVVWIGYSGERKVERGEEQVGASRGWSIPVDDLNTVLERRIFTSDGANRPAETDVERMQALLTLPETLLIDDDTYLSTANPVDMDANDYRKQTVAQYIDSCRQQSGKNSFLTWLTHPTLGGHDIAYSLWYGHDSLETFSSAIRISNIAADIDHVTTFAASDDTELTRDPGRVYSGVIVDFDGDWVYVTRPETATDFALGGRDTTMSAPWIKTKAAAIRYGKRVLADMATEEDIITTTIVVDAAQLNALMAGHRVEARFSHFPDYTEWTWFRVQKRTIRQREPGRYELPVVLTPPVPVTAAGTVYGALLHSHGWATSDVVWEREGGSGTAFPATSGDIAAIIDGAKPDKRDHTGWLVEADGTIDVTFHASMTAVVMGAITVTWAILKNGVVIASDSHVTTGGLRRYSDSETVSIAGLEVEDGDEITATVTPTGLHWFFSIPAGVGTQNERLEITAGSLA